MSDGAPRTNRELVLPPGSYAYLQDATTGAIKACSGPIVVNQTAQEKPVRYVPRLGGFETCDRLEDAVCKSPVAVEGYYMILLNPAEGGEHPTDGATKAAPPLSVGRRVNVPGPCMFSLWPGQSAKVVRGHHLRSNQYLVIKVYNAEEAAKNWRNAIVKPAVASPAATPPREGEGEKSSEDPSTDVLSAAPPDLAVGQQFIIRGTDVAFYIPPTGITVTQREGEYVRDALTLERLDYCILVDEGGRKRYEQGPQVVFPEPTEKFLHDDKGRIRFRALELNEIQGLHVKVIAAYKGSDIENPSGDREYKEGEEIFITGKYQSIYFPREEHAIVSYDGKQKHFATAVPPGEGRYVMDRKTGFIKLIQGPTMLLPNPVSEVIIRRALSDTECATWYPNNEEALAYNRELRQVAEQAPTTRAGAVSEGDLNRSRSKRDIRHGKSALRAANLAMESSGVSSMANMMAGDEVTRTSTYTQPRFLVLEGRFSGVPRIQVWTGYAVMVVKATGERRVVQGPATLLLEYDETLEVLSLSTGKPKTTDNLLRTAYLLTRNNKVSELVRVETKDHVSVDIKLSLLVHFEGQNPHRWFEIANYTKFLCDHVRSLLKGRIRKVSVEEFYASPTDFVRDTILGIPAEGSRPGLPFAENGMRVADVEVLDVSIADHKIAQLLYDSQHDVVQGNIVVARAQRQLEHTKEQEKINREDSREHATTVNLRLDLQKERIEQEAAVAVARLLADLQEHEKGQEVEKARQEKLAIEVDAELARDASRAAQRIEVATKEQVLRLEELRAETEAAVNRFAEVQGGLSEALLALSSNETLEKVARAMSAQTWIGGRTVTDVLGKVFKDTPFGSMIQAATDRVSKQLPGPNGRSDAGSDALDQDSDTQ